MRRVPRTAAALLLLGCLLGCAGGHLAPLLAADWHHPLYLANDGYWRQRVPVEIVNGSERDAAGDPVSLGVGTGEGEADIARTPAEAVRVCDAAGAEMLFRITDAEGKQITMGPIPAGASFTIPVECKAGATVAYYIYFDNPAAWAVPDFLEVGAGAANGSDVEGARRPRLRAAAGKPERIDVAEAGAGAPWPPGAQLDARVPVKVTNLSGEPLERMLVAAGLARFARRGEAGSRLETALVADGSTPAPFYRHGDTVLFESSVPPMTVKTFHAYLAPARGAAKSLAERHEALLESARNLAANPSFEREGEQGALASGWTRGAGPPGAVMDLSGPGLFGKRGARMHIPHGVEKSWAGWRQEVPVKPDRTYLYAAWVKCEDVRGGDVQIHGHHHDREGRLSRLAGFANVGPALSGTTDWTLLSGFITMPGDAASFEIHLTMLATGTVSHDGVVLAEVAFAETGKLEAREAEAAHGLEVWPENALVKVFQDDLPPREAAPARISLARNEKEALQLVVRGPAAIGGVTVEVSPPAAASGARLEVGVAVVGYVPIDHPTSYYSDVGPTWRRRFPRAAGACDGWAGMWPDPLLPRSAFDLAPATTQPVWITLSAPESAVAGEYLGSVKLRAGGGTLKEVPFTVTVRGFALPAESHVAAIYDLRLGPAWTRAGESPAQAARRFWHFLAERRICPDRVLPEPILKHENGRVTADFTEYDAAAEVYFGELKLPFTYSPHAFYLFGWGHPPEARFGEAPYEGAHPYAGVDRGKLRPAYKKAYQACLRAYWDHLKEKGWDRRCILYISDEPFDNLPSIREQMKALCDMIHEVDPAIPIYSSTWHHQPEWDGRLDVWGIGHHGPVTPGVMKEIKARGSRIWFTTDGQMCTDTPFCAVERLLPHYCFHHGAEAYEFWGVSWLTYDPYRFGWHSFIRQSEQPGEEKWIRYPNGDGYLMYPGGPIGHDGPVSSIRLEQAREGVEDFEYLRLLSGLRERALAAGKDAPGAGALERARKLVPIPNAGGRFSTRILPDPDAVLEVRDALARAIEECLRG